MSNHPHRLHAQAAAWSLCVAWPHLTRAAEAARAAADADNDRGALRSTTFGTRHASGPVSDSTALAALTGGVATVTANRYERIADGITTTLTWLSGVVVPHTSGPPLELLIAAIPTLRPSVALSVTVWLREADGRIRAALRLQPDHLPMPGNPPCPYCSTRMLRVQTSAPDTARWTVVCAAGCHCTGPDCPCGMPVRVDGVAHIWDASSALVSDALGSDNGPDEGVAA